MAISSESLQKLLPLLRPLMQVESQRRGYLMQALGMNTPVLNRLVEVMTKQLKFGVCLADLIEVVKFMIHSWCEMSSNAVLT